MSLLRLLIVCALLLLLPVDGVAATRMQPLTEGEMREAVERFLAQRFADRGWQYRITRLTLPQGVSTSPGVRDLELVIPPAWGGWEPVSAALVVRINGTVEKNLPLRLQLEVTSPMVTARHNLPAGTVLTADDLELRPHELSRVDGQPLSDPAEAIGKKTRTAVKAGMPIKPGQLAAVPVVVSGQLVTIVAENEGVRITVSGRARSNGGIGDLIRVQNLTSQKEIPARVLDASTVAVGF